MTETPNIAYDVCRLYIRDHEASLPADLTSKILGLIRARRFDRLAEASTLLDSAKLEPFVFKHVRQIEAFFRKNDAFADSDRCMTACRLSFERAEKLCRITNKRLDHYFRERERLAPDLSLYMDRMQRYLHRVLGPFDEFLSGLPDLIRVSPGATESSSRANSIPYLKVRKKLRAPRGAWPYLNALSQYFGYGKLHLEHADLNRVEVVPKTWKTHRTIACEPNGSMPLQLAFDTYAKSRLSRHGINLHDQTLNQTLAMEASLLGGYATVDLSMASDTLSYNLVAWLLPYDWFCYLDAIRAKGYKGCFGHGVYSKFSSMGNGATFCLETLVFAAACYAVGSKDFSVYGDDIIIEDFCYPKLLRLLRFLGFVVNQDKTFHEGPFRESCGKDWFLGIDVTPLYLRRDPATLSQWAHFVNQIVTLGTADGALWKLAKSIVDERRLLLVPYNADSSSGVWLDVSTAYEAKIIRMKCWQLKYRSYVLLSRSKIVADSRTHFLWFTGSPYRKSERISSSVPSTSHKYVRKWIHWFPPVERTPVHLYRWAEFMTSQVWPRKRPHTARA